MSHKSNSLTCLYLNDGQVVYCEVSAGGIFIPMPEHIEKFCRSVHPQRCYHYLKSNELLQHYEKYNSSDFSETRRLHRRFNQKFPLFVDTSSGGVAPQAIKYTGAFTVDLSLGGLQVSTIKELEPEQKVSFLFDGAFSKPFWKGLGEVRWCKPVEPENRFLAGLSFIDQSHKSIMAHHLGVQPR